MSGDTWAVIAIAVLFVLAIVLALAETAFLRMNRVKALSLEELQGINSAITKDVYSVLSVDKSVESRTSFGGTAPAEVRKQIRYWRKRLAKL